MIARNSIAWGILACFSWLAASTVGASASVVIASAEDPKPCVRTAPEARDPDAVRAAFIYNFARFTTWPPDLPATDSFVICVLGDTAVGDALERAVAGRQLMDRPITITRVNPATPKRTCRILYVSGVPVREAAAVVAELRETPVLTISNVEGFASAGGMTQFFFEHGQLRFRIHLESAKRAGLQISSRLLVMARPND